MTGLVRDDFAGPGGWDEGLRGLGITDVVGIDSDHLACRTAVAAGHRRLCADVRTVDPGPWVGIDGYIASPPCTSFSPAGRGAGAKVLPELAAAASRVAAGDDSDLEFEGDETIGLILEPVRQVRDLRPRWVALEQVARCLPIWKTYGHLFGQWGYSVKSAVLCAADFGVPQVRKRAFLVARLDGPAVLPEQSHAEPPSRVLSAKTMPVAAMFDDELQPWVTMASALGWGPTASSASVHRGDRAGWAWERPATTVTEVRVAAPGWRGGRDDYRSGGELANQFDSAIFIDSLEATILQSFPPDYPWQGLKTVVFEQIGNAVPPRLATAVVGALLGLDWRSAVEEVARQSAARPGVRVSGREDRRREIRQAERAASR